MRLGARHSSPRANAFKQYIIVSSPQKLLKVSLISLFLKSPYSQSSVSPIHSSTKGYYGTPTSLHILYHHFGVVYSLLTDLTSLVLPLNHSPCYSTQVHLLAAQKPIIERQVSVERKDASISKASSLGGRWIHVPRPTLSILLSHDSF